MKIPGSGGNVEWKPEIGGLEIKLPVNEPCKLAYISGIII